MTNLNYADCETKISQLLSEGKRSWEIINNLENDYDFFLIQVCYNNLINYKTKHNIEEDEINIEEENNIEEEKNNITNLDETFSQQINRNDASYRKLVMGKYNNYCPISNKNIACDVAHIKEFKDCLDNNERYDPDNGIYLLTTIHRLWDTEKLIYLCPNDLCFKINTLKPNAETILKNNQYGYIIGVRINQLDNPKSKYYIQSRYDIDFKK